MENLRDTFKERLDEVDSYIDFLLELDKHSKNGPPRLEGACSPISVTQQRILYSGVFLHLYNLVESTMTMCIDAVARAAYSDKKLRPGDLADTLKREWVRSFARTHTDMASDKRLDSAIKLCQHLVDSLPIPEFTIEKGGGGNWDDDAIEQMTERLGFKLKVNRSVYRGVKSPFRDDLGPLALVKSLRNKLAHGAISFSESVGSLDVGRLSDLKNKLVDYLREVIRCFSEFISAHEYLCPRKRPV
ncbi:MAE_28990/MAE_18760 family HEPN-like nuclease [Pseudomonas shirazica]|uniref:MAE_28990/MAE_18760 family HEPN-like nuclease n=1 Tax=Pseudomonas shirazica TaxID=1940636 RepID=UPI0025A9511F|nr:MAE_28990/MAE_18760 family HEPN-like nuclease [Pseudomonas shirazica]MDM9601064.1 MAE_28990/MAE_18760 family HEPN-like nuclease [Pseudomonas shirazica]MDO2414450.1 MAE_28990/MAE_18760 family HEPN-like nuclease [Pseudomonas shirazica]